MSRWFAELVQHILSLKNVMPIAELLFGVCQHHSSKIPLTSIARCTGIFTKPPSAVRWDVLNHRSTAYADKLIKVHKKWLSSTSLGTCITWKKQINRRQKSDKELIWTPLIIALPLSIIMTFGFHPLPTAKRNASKNTLIVSPHSLVVSI